MYLHLIFFVCRISWEGDPSWRYPDAGYWRQPGCSTASWDDRSWGTYMSVKLIIIMIVLRFWIHIGLWQIHISRVWYKTIVIALFSITIYSSLAPSPRNFVEKTPPPEYALPFDACMLMLMFSGDIWEAGVRDDGRERQLRGSQEKLPWTHWAEAHPSQDTGVLWWGGWI